MKHRENLIGTLVEINLIFTDAEDYSRLNKPIPIMPTIRGTLIKRVFSWSWCYVMILDRPLLLDMEGIGEKARSKMFTNYVFISPSYRYKNNKEDNIYIRLVKMNEAMINVVVNYVNNPSDIPNELITGEKTDPYFEKILPISIGQLRIVDKSSQEA